MRIKRPIDLIVTRHGALRDLLVERGYATPDTPVITHVDDPAVLRGRHVAGVLPLRLAVAADIVSEIDIAMTPADRGAATRGALPIERLREIAGAIRTYRVEET